MSTNQVTTFVPSPKLIDCVIGGYCERDPFNCCPESNRDGLIQTINRGVWGLFHSMTDSLSSNDKPWYFVTLSAYQLHPEVLNSLLGVIHCRSDMTTIFDTEVARCLTAYAMQAKSPQSSEIWNPNLELVGDKVALLAEAEVSKDSATSEGVKRPAIVVWKPPRSDDVFQ